MNRSSLALSMLAALALVASAQGQGPLFSERSERGASADAATPRPVEIRIRHSKFAPANVVVPAGVPVTFVLVNEDPIDHEWLVGDAAFHERHRGGGETAHGDRPDEVSLPAFATRTTTLTLAPGTHVFVCHFPRHEAYGMVGVVTAR